MSSIVTPGLLEGALAGDVGDRPHQPWPAPSPADEVADVVVGLGLADAEQRDLALRVAALAASRDDVGGAAVVDQRALEPAQRRGDHRRAGDVLEGDRLALEGRRVEHGVLARGHRDRMQRVLSRPYSCR